MAGLSKHLALALFNMALNPVRSSYTPPAGLWVAIHTDAPNDSTYGNEANYGGYLRQPMTSLTASPVAGDAVGDVDIEVVNGAPLVYPVSTGTVPQRVSHWAIWDSEAAGSGNIVVSGELGYARTISLGDSIVVPEGNLVITIK